MNIMRATRLCVGLAVAASAVAIGASSTEAAPLRCQGKIVTIKGNARGNVINGTKRADVIHSMGGNDIVRGNGGNDTICLGAGNDKAFGGPGRDKINGNGGNDLINGGAGIDLMIGAAGADLIDGAGGGGDAKGQKGIDACYNATQPKSSGCEKDQLWDSSAANIERSDLVESAKDRGPFAYHSTDQNLPIAGRTFRRGLGCTGVDLAGDYCEWTFKLARRYARFAAFVGTDDRSLNTGAVNSFEVEGDGNLIESKVLGYGKRAKLVTNVSGVLNLTIRVRFVSGTTGASTHTYFTDPRVARNPNLAPAAPIN